MAKAMKVCQRAAPWTRLVNCGPSMPSPAISGRWKSTSRPIITLTASIMAPAICNTGTPEKSAAAISLKMMAGNSTK